MQFSDPRCLMDELLLFDHIQNESFDQGLRKTPSAPPPLHLLMFIIGNFCKNSVLTVGLLLVNSERKKTWIEL